MTRVLVIGSRGMLGHDLIRELKDYEVAGMGRQQLDIRETSAVYEAVRGFDVVINAAAYTNVDQAESNSEVAFAVNAGGARNLAQATAAHGSHLIQISTDYVFDGNATRPYSETDPTNPVSVYGKSKRDGEVAVVEENPESTIVRTSWLYGEHGSHFPGTIASLGKKLDFIDVVADQTGQPTASSDVARMIGILMSAGLPSGVFHATNSGQTSWFDFAHSLFARAGWDANRIRPTTSNHFVRPAHRPSWSVLGHQRWETIGVNHPRHWSEALDEAWEIYLGKLFSDEVL